MGRSDAQAKWLTETLKLERRKRGLSLKGAADLVSPHLGREISAQSMLDWENGKTGLKLDQLNAWAAAFDLKCDVRLVQAESGFETMVIPPDAAVFWLRFSQLNVEDRERVSDLIDRLAAVKL